jgi:hypothetical protein
MLFGVIVGALAMIPLGIGLWLTVTTFNKDEVLEMVMAFGSIATAVTGAVRLYYGRT